MVDLDAHGRPKHSLAVITLARRGSARYSAAIWRMGHRKDQHDPMRRVASGCLNNENNAEQFATLLPSVEWMLQLRNTTVQFGSEAALDGGQACPTASSLPAGPRCGLQGS